MLITANQPTDLHIAPSLGALDCIKRLAASSPGTRSDGLLTIGNEFLEKRAQPLQYFRPLRGDRR
jgi:hypothetical protein